MDDPHPDWDPATMRTSGATLVSAGKTLEDQAQALAGAMAHLGGEGPALTDAQTTLKQQAGILLDVGKGLISVGQRLARDADDEDAARAAAQRFQQALAGPFPSLIPPPAGG